MSLKYINTDTASDLLEQGAWLVDIRSVDEYVREHIEQARHISLEQLTDAELLDAPVAVIFYCRSGNRTHFNAQLLSRCVSGQSYCLEGGLDAWKKAGRAVVKDVSQPIELQRQVQIVAGLLILAGFVLGILLSPWFHILSGVIGAGLVFSGVSGFCGLARLLVHMPWNNPR